MLLHDILWIEDDAPFVEGILKNFKEDSEDLKYSISPFHYVSLQEFKENSNLELSALVMKVVCVDYNLPGGINGDEVILLIRQNGANKNIPIVFYSFAKNEQELEALIVEKLDDRENIFYSQKDTLEDYLRSSLE